MQRGYYSPFWLAGGVLTDALWEERDDDDPLSLEELRRWLHLSDAERSLVVEQYVRLSVERCPAAVGNVGGDAAHDEYDERL